MRQPAKKALALVMLGILIGLGGYCVLQLYEAHEAYAEGNRAYENIMQQVISGTAPDASEPPAGENASEGETEAIYVPEREIDFAALKTICADAVGIIYCPDTAIDYPVAKGTDNSYYLRHLPDGSYNINGTLFLDYTCAGDFTDSMSVIYGHNMKSGKMFGSLVEYKNQSYYDAHPYMYLYTETQNYRIKLLYGAVVTAERWSEEGYAGDAESLLEYAREHTTFASAEEYDPDERLIVLSTCSYEYQDARYVVVANLQPT